MRNEPPKIRPNKTAPWLVGVVEREQDRGQADGGEQPRYDEHGRAGQQRAPDADEDARGQEGDPSGWPASGADPTQNRNASPSIKKA
jgi:hypothetical protein